MRHVFVFILICFFDLFLPSQNTFHKSFIATDPVYVKTMIMLHDSGFFLVGPTTSYNNCFVVRTDANGDTLWTKYYSNFNVTDVIETSDNGFFMKGDAPSTNPLPVIKIDSAGNVQWAKNITGVYRTGGICQTGDGGFEIAAEHDNNPFDEAVVLKLDMNGNLLWSNYFSLGIISETKGIIAMPNGGSAVIGDYYANSHYYPVLYRIDAGGNLSWAKSVYVSSDDQPNYFYRKSNGHLVFAGMSVASQFILETDSSANPSWMKMYSGQVTPINSISGLSNGGYVLGTGNTTSSFSPGSIITTDSVGNLTNIFTYDSIPLASVFSAGNGYTATGISFYGSYLLNINMFHVDASGNGTCSSMQTQSYSRQAPTAFVQTVSPNSGTLSVSIAPFIVNTSRGCTIDTTCQIPFDLLVYENQKNLSCTIFPQPFHENATMEFSTELNHATLCIYNVLGENIYCQENISGKEIHLENSQLKNGLFFYRVSENGNVIASGKLLAE